MTDLAIQVTLTREAVDYILEQIGTDINFLEDEEETPETQQQLEFLNKLFTNLVSKL